MLSVYEKKTCITDNGAGSASLSGISVVSEQLRLKSWPDTSCEESSETASPHLRELSVSDGQQQDRGDARISFIIRPV